MDDVAWGVLALALTVLGATYTYLSYQRRGLVAALRGAGLTLLVPAAYLTDTLRMFTRIADAVADWATGLVLSPSVWLGVIVAAVAAVLLGTSRVLRVRGPRERKAVGSTPEPAAAPPDDDMAEIEAILRRRGIS